MTTIPAHEITFHPQSFSDTMRVFWWRGEVYRAVSDAQADFVRGLFADGVVAALTVRGLLIESEITPLALDGYALVVHHRRVPFVAYPDEWSPPMYASAAHAVLDLTAALLPWGLTLVDAHPWNMLFDPGRQRPVYVDWGSIVPLAGSTWQEEDQFCRFLLNPLLLMSRGHGRLARLLVGADALGVRALDLAAVVPADARTDRAVWGRPDRPWAWPGWARRWTSARHPVARMWRAGRAAVTSLAGAGAARGAVDQSAYRECLDRMRRRVDAVALPDITPRRFLNATTARGWTARQAAVAAVLDARTPGSVLDVGCGDGWCAKLAASRGRPVVAIDVDEASISQLFHDATHNRLSVLPLVLDFARPTPARGWGASGGLSAIDRLRSDVVLSLGLVHELALGMPNPWVGHQYLSFDQIAEGLAAFSVRGALVEFTSLDAPALAGWRTSYHAANYRLDYLSAALQRHFRTVEAAATYGSATLLWCGK